MIKTNKVYSAEIKDINADQRTLVAVISTSAKDRMDESVAHDGVNLKDYQKNPVVLWAHDYATPPIAKALWVKKDNNAQGLVSKMQFADTAFAKEIFSLYQGGFMKAFSIGFIPKQITRNYQQEGYDKTKDPYITISKWDMLEYSAVPVPANPEALSLAMSKGLISKETMDILETKDLHEDVVSEFDNETQVIIHNDKTISTSSSPNQMDEFIAENNLLNERIKKLELANSNLRVDLFRLLNIKKQLPSEISADDIYAKVQEIVSGEIRRAQGKVD